MSDHTHLLARAPLFSALDPDTREALATTLETVLVHGGEALFREGDRGDALYLVAAGCLGVFTRDGRAFAEIPVGQVVGEMALLTDRPRSATVAAVRDSVVLRLGRAEFERLIEAHPRALLGLTQAVLARTGATHRDKRAPRTFALIPEDRGVNIRPFADHLATALRALRPLVEVIDARNDDQEPSFFEAIDAETDAVLYVAEAPDGPWASRCVRQADAVLVVARADGTGPVRWPGCLSRLTERVFQPRVELALLHPADDIPAGQTAPRLGASPFALHHHIRPGHREDISRLSRLLTHRAVGLVLAGGGARGFAHLGVVKAMREAGIPIDMVGGASMGAIVGAGVAMGWTEVELFERFHASFVKTNPLSDWRLPTVSVYAGDKVGRLLQVAFGERHIEDVPAPFYAMVADIDAARAIPERRGVLWQHLRTSASIPGLLPPRITDGSVLVDGGTLENFPVGPMLELSRGPVVGVDIDTTGGLGEDDVPAWQHWWARARGRREGPVLPRIVRILLRSAMAGSTARARLARDQVDLLFLPPVHDIDLLDWGSMERAMERGYRHASEHLERQRGTAQAAWWAAT